MNTSFFRVLILAVVLALMAEIVHCELIDCDKASCPDSPVMVQFEHLNCSGAQRFLYLNETWNGCKDKSWGPYVSSERQSYTDTFYVKESYASRDCDKNMVVPAPTSADYNFFGVCRPVEPWDPESGAINYLGKMYLKNANQNFVSPQIPVFIPDVPEMDVGWKECANISDCQASGFYFIAEFNETCNAEPTYTVVVGPSPGICYQNPLQTSVYTSARCTGPHSIEQIYSKNADCSHPFQADLGARTCSTGNYVTTFCTATSPVPSPSSGASSVQMSVLVILLALAVYFSLH